MKKMMTMVIAALLAISSYSLSMENTQILPHKNNGNTELHRLCQQDNAASVASVVQLLREHPNLLNTQNDEGLTAIALLAEKAFQMGDKGYRLESHVKMITLLVNQQGIDLETPGLDGRAMSQLQELNKLKTEGRLNNFPDWYYQPSIYAADGGCLIRDLNNRNNACLDALIKKYQETYPAVSF